MKHGGGLPPPVFTNLLMADLTTIADYKDAEGINNPKHDLRLEALVPSVSQLVKTYCGNSIIDFFTDDKVETLSINYDIDQIQLTESPVNTIDSITERASETEAYTTLVENTDYALDKTTDIVFRLNKSDDKIFSWLSSLFNSSLFWLAFI